jgi:hypothetical protein
MTKTRLTILWIIIGAIAGLASACNSSGSKNSSSDRFTIKWSGDDGWSFQREDDAGSAQQ